MTRRLLTAILGVGFGVLAAAGGAWGAGDGRELVAARVPASPAIDGRGGDPCWFQAVPLVTRDPLAQIEIELRAVHTGEEVFVLARFPDATESRDHQTLHWNPATEKYGSGPEREDAFVLKWSMEPVPVNLTVRGDDAYLADVWYWKAHRTDPRGYADDKIQTYSEEGGPEATRLISGSGRAFFLRRNGDRGEPVYQVLVHDRRDQDRMPKYAYSQPTGSRADVRAKGRWEGGFWTVEFARRLDTGNPDDVSFSVPGRYQFGVSRFEIAGREPDPSLEEPLFASGDVSEELWLVLR